MDKKNTLIGVALMAAAIAFLIYGNSRTPPPSTLPPVTTTAPAPGTTAPGAPAAPSLTAPAAPAAATSTFAALVSDDAEAEVTTLRNGFVEVRLSDFGGAVREVAFRQYPAVQNEPAPFVFNALRADPILAFADFPGLDRRTRYELVSSSATEAVYRLVLEDRIEVTRRYSIQPAGATVREGDDPYEIRHETSFRNLTDQTIALPRAALSLGTAAPFSALDYGQYLNVGFFDGEDFRFNERSELQGGGFLAGLGFGDPNPKPQIEQQGSVLWATVKNQFFASILHLDQPGSGIVTRRVELPPFPGTTTPNIGVAGTVRVDLKALAPQATETFGGDLYVGPKEYKRLASLPNQQDRVMQFDRYFFNRILLSGYVGPFLLTLMHSAHDFVPSWGWAIVLMTLFLKIITLPFTLAASRAAKRMQKLQPQLQAVREKHQDNPQKLNQATMEIFKENKVNPLGGCLPILITIPLFVGFFAMLQSASELRFASFLWAHDLSAPDTVARIFGLPLNIMPLLMGATMIVQMRLTPTPTTDNLQVKMMQFMPIIFTLFCYNFSCALALYSTVNGLFTIIQQLLVNKFSKDDPAPTAAPAAAGGNPWKPAKRANKK
ncbi:MAG: membrane protein insertase YidC [Verrucomicrobia bacterium]|nr:membrane protein insertase YidC [Verrucomicrobiota bacterium]